MTKKYKITNETNIDKLHNWLEIVSTFLALSNLY